MEIAGQICKQDTVGGGKFIYFYLFIYFFLVGWMAGEASYLTNGWDRDSLIKSAEKRDSTCFGLFLFQRCFLIIFRYVCE